MQFDLDELNPGTVFDLDEKDPAKGNISVRIATPEVLLDIKKKTVKTKYKFHGGRAHLIEDPNEKEADALLWDYCIVGWEGLVDANKQPIAVTAKNKVKLMNGSIVFRNIVNDALDRLRAIQAEMQETALGN